MKMNHNLSSDSNMPRRPTQKHGLIKHITITCEQSVILNMITYGYKKKTNLFLDLKLKIYNIEILKQTFWKENISLKRWLHEKHFINLLAFI